MDQATLLDYLVGTTNVCAKPDPNHNTKYDCYETMGESCATCIGHYIIDLDILADAEFTTELFKPWNYASDAVLLQLLFWFNEADHPKGL